MGDDEGLSPFQQRQQRRKRGLPKDVARERQLERSRRHAEAQRRAKLVLADRYAAEYRELYEAECAVIDKDRGPLPGDE
jgi:hypothetical protein